MTSYLYDCLPRGINTRIIVTTEARRTVPAVMDPPLLHCIVSNPVMMTTVHNTMRMNKPTPIPNTRAITKLESKMMTV